VKDLVLRKLCCVDNGILVCKEVHNRIHAVVREGKDFEEAVEIVREEYKNVKSA
jgi:hypothetical protein